MPVGIVQERIPKNVYQLKIQSGNEQSLGSSRAVLLGLGYNEGDLVSSCLKGELKR